MGNESLEYRQFDGASLPLQCSHETSHYPGYCEVRKVDAKDESGRTRLFKARDLLAERLAYFDAKAAQLKKDLDGAKAAKEDAFAILQITRAQGVEHQQCKR